MAGPAVLLSLSSSSGTRATKHTTHPGGVAVGAGGGVTALEGLANLGNPRSGSTHGEGGSGNTPRGAATRGMVGDGLRG